MRKILFYVLMHTLWSQITFSYTNDREKRAIILTYEEALNIVNGIELIAEQYRTKENRKQVRACYNNASTQSSIPGVCGQSSDTILIQLLTYAQAIKRELNCIYDLVSGSQSDEVDQIISQVEVAIYSKIDAIEQTLLNEIEMGAIETTIAMSDVFDQLTQSEALLCSKIIALDVSIIHAIEDSQDILFSEIVFAANDLSQTQALVCSKIVALDISLVNQIEGNQDIILSEIITAAGDISQTQLLISSKIDDLRLLINDVETTQDIQVMNDENNLIITMSQINRIEQILRGQLC